MCGCGEHVRGRGRMSVVSMSVRMRKYECGVFTCVVSLTSHSTHTVHIYSGSKSILSCFVTVTNSAQNWLSLTTTTTTINNLVATGI